MTEEKRKFRVSYGRTVQTMPYETARFDLSIEYFVGEKDPDEAFKEIRKKILSWIKVVGRFG